jgi:hypothetical protein
MYLSYMIRNRSQKFWDIYQGYLLTFEQGDRLPKYQVQNFQPNMFQIEVHKIQALNKLQQAFS